jgi:hypothetical protein
VSQPTPQRPTADKGRHGTGAEKNTWANGGRRDESARWQDARLTSISPVRFRFPPFPPPLPRVRTGHAHLTVTANPTSTRATQSERDPPHTASPLLGSPNFFFSSFFLSLSLSLLKIAIPQSKHFPLFLASLIAAAAAARYCRRRRRRHRHRHRGR